jgi:hypothetical protein
LGRRRRSYIMYVGGYRGIDGMERGRRSYVGGILG